MPAAVTVAVSVTGEPLATVPADKTRLVIVLNLETVIVPEAPAMELVTVSVAVMVWLPTVFSVAGNVPTPLVKVLLAGSAANPSVLLKCTVPE